MDLRQFCGLQPNKKDQQIESTTKPDQAHLPWVEKYRPSNLNDVVFQTEIISSLKNSIRQGKLQHLLFHGPPGTGKTSTILAAARDMFGIEFRDRVLELNASDERGINVIREKVKTYSQKKLTKLDKTVPNIQIVILDEADQMTQEAQSALRRIIEDYSKTTRFCIICNYLSKIIDPIASRCAKYMFNPLSKDTQYFKINEILSKENISMERSTVEEIIEICEGDLRKSINQVQALCSLDDKIDQTQVKELCGIIPKETIDEILRFLKRKILSVKEIYETSENLLNEGYDVSQLSKQINYILSDEMYLESIGVDDEKAAKISLCLVDHEMISLEGGDDEALMSSLLCSLRKVIN